MRLQCHMDGKIWMLEDNSFTSSTFYMEILIFFASFAFGVYNNDFFTIILVPYLMLYHNGKNYYRLEVHSWQKHYNQCIKAFNSI